MKPGGYEVWLGSGWWHVCAEGAEGVTGWEGLGQLWGVALGLHVGLPETGQQAPLLSKPSAQSHTL